MAHARPVEAVIRPRLGDVAPRRLVVAMVMWPAD